MNEGENLDDELYDGTCVQDARDPLVHPRYCVSSVAVRMSERIRIDGGVLNLQDRTVWAEAVTCDSMNAVCFTPVTPGSTMRARTPPVRAPAHTSIGLMISLMKETSGYEPDIPRV